MVDSSNTNLQFSFHAGDTEAISDNDSLSEYDDVP
jgi:hypothetical protein